MTIPQNYIDRLSAHTGLDIKHIQALPLEITPYHTTDCAYLADRGVVYYTDNATILNLVHTVGILLFCSTTPWPEECYSFLGWEWAVYKWLGDDAIAEFLTSAYTIDVGEDHFDLGDLDVGVARTCLDNIQKATTGRMCAYIDRLQ